MILQGNISLDEIITGLQIHVDKFLASEGSWVQAKEAWTVLIVC